MTDSKLIFTKVCNSEKNMNEIYKLLFSGINPNKKLYLLIGHGSPFYHKKLQKVLGSESYIISIEDESFRYSWKYMKKDEDVFFINLNDINQLKSILIHILTKIDMKKFDGIIMNPPYKGTLHLEIVSECLKHLSENGKITNLGPIRWLIDPSSDYKQNTDIKRFQNVASSIEEIPYLFSANEITQLFGGENQIQIPMDVAVYVLSKTKNNFDYKNFKWTLFDKDLFDKIIKSTCKLNNVKFIKYDETKHKYFVPIRVYANWYRNTRYNIWTGSNILTNGKDMNGIYWKDTLYKSKSFKEDRILQGIPFNSFEKAKNFYDSLHLIHYKYLISLLKSDAHTTELTTIWLDNIINPRTGLKGYLSNWTNEDLDVVFSIAKSKEQEIEDSMKKYAVEK